MQRDLAMPSLSSWHLHYLPRWYSKKFYIDFAAHIFFDDAFTLESDGSSLYVINSFVRDMLVSLPLAAKEVQSPGFNKIDPPLKFPTPYGGRLEYKLPGGTYMYVHLKDKAKIRHRKRWSQVII